MRNDDDDEDRLINPREVRRMFGVTPRTVTRWASTGKLNAIKTPGGHRRFRESDVRALLEHQPGRIDPTN